MIRGRVLILICKRGPVDLPAEVIQGKRRALLIHFPHFADVACA
ncbi:hypothetical protein SAMN05192541_15020 [Bradyrhizobium arachidis]|nr:hypothetical protein SAMN05192541_15020 [Bradyrhizobium arachidis]